MQLADYAIRCGYRAARSGVKRHAHRHVRRTLVRHVVHRTVVHAAKAAAVGAVVWTCWVPGARPHAAVPSAPPPPSSATSMPGGINAIGAPAGFGEDSGVWGPLPPGAFIEKGTGAVYSPGIWQPNSPVPYFSGIAGIAVKTLPCVLKTTAIRHVCALTAHSVNEPGAILMFGSGLTLLLIAAGRRREG